jgi:hypothetical protein
MLSPAWLSTFIGAAFTLPAKAMAIASALSGDGSPRFRMSSFDSILMRPRGTVWAQSRGKRAQADASKGYYSAVHFRIPEAVRSNLSDLYSSSLRSEGREQRRPA